MLYLVDPNPPNLCPVKNNRLYGTWVYRKFAFDLDVGLRVLLSSIMLLLLYDLTIFQKTLTFLIKIMSNLRRHLFKKVVLLKALSTRLMPASSH